MLKGLLVVILLAVAAAGGVAAGYYLWGIHKDWYAVDIAKLGPGAENDLIRYGRDLIVNTPKHLGKNAVTPAMRYAGNDLACQNCHLNAGLQAFAAPFVSTFASFPMMVDDQVLTLTRRINGCMRRSMNGKDLPPESREMEALIAYFKFVGKGTPEGVRIAGMGLKPIASPTEPPDARRGETVYAKLLRKLSQGGWSGRAAHAAGDRLYHPAALGRCELQCRRRHGQDRLCRFLHSRQHAVRRQLSRAAADRAAGLGRGRLHDFEAASGRDAGNLVRSGIRQRPRVLTRETQGRL